MIISQRTFQLLLELGAPADKLAAVLHALDDDLATFTAPSPGAERTRRWREKKEAERHKTSPTVTETSPRDASQSVTERHKASPCDGLAHVENKPLEVILLDSDVVDVDAREPNDWPNGSARDHAAALIDELGSPWLDPQKSLDLTTTVGRFAIWKREGASWRNDVLPVVAKLCEKNRKPVKSWKFFDAAIAQSIADNRAALVIPMAVSHRSTGPPSLTDRIAADNAESRRRTFELLKANG